MVCANTHPNCVLCTVYCVLCTVYCVLCTVYCVLCTVYCVLCTVYCVLCTVYCVLCTVYVYCESPKGVLFCSTKVTDFFFYFTQTEMEIDLGFSKKTRFDPV